MNIRRAVLSVVVVCVFSSVAFGQPWAGNGVEGDPYQIWDACDMQAIGADSNYWDAHFVLCVDINLGAYTGTSFNIIGSYTSENNNEPFTGVFDGNGHNISNFTYSSSGANYIGVFGYVNSANAEIKGLFLNKASVSAGSGRFVGSLVGRLMNGTVTECSVEVSNISGNSQIGGLLGGADQPAGEVSECFYSGTVTGNTTVGGIIGSNGKEIYNCYATGNVSGNEYIGGLVGFNRGFGGIFNCYSTCGVSGASTIGGLVGLNDEGVIVNSFWDVDTSGLAGMCGLQWYGGNGCDNAYGKTTGEMQTASTFFGWGCDGAWTIDDGNDYPHLVWEGEPGEVIMEPTYGGGSGDPNDPFLIYTAEQLNTIGLVYCHLDSHFELAADINLVGHTATKFNIIGSQVLAFSGVFDGNGHTISNFVYDCNGLNYVGLFRHIKGNEAEIRNLGLVDPNVEVRADFEEEFGRRVGSLVGYSSYGTVRNCYVEGGRVRGEYEVGGLVGNNYRGNIFNSYSSADVSGVELVGGLVGRSYSGMIRNCYAASSVWANQHVAGGLAGSSESAIWNCYSIGDVNASFAPIGGLVGSNGGAVKYSYWDMQTSGVSSSAGGTGKTTTEMKTASTFIGWGSCDNTGVWTIDEPSDYPRLWWENKPGSPLVIQELSDYLTGTGEANAPYLVYTANDLDMITIFPCEWDKHFTIAADINASTVSEDEYVIGEYIGEGGPDYPFSGVFDGDGHVISNLRINRGKSGVGFFGYVCCGGEIRDLGLEDALINVGAGYRTGTLVGYNNGGKILNCFGTGRLQNNYWYGGGLVGHNAGGGSLSNCYSSVWVSWGGHYAGGLVGCNESLISDCYSTEPVAGYLAKGGLVGRNEGTVEDSFWDVNNSGVGSSAGGTGKTTVEMQMESTFTDAGWDFVGEVINGPNDIWDICEGTNYPKFVWQIPAADFVCPDGVTFIDFSVLGLAWYSDPNQPNWNLICDISEPNDNFIDELDLKVFTENWLAGL